MNSEWLWTRFSLPIGLRGVSFQPWNELAERHARCGNGLPGVSSPTFPDSCPKSTLILAELLTYLQTSQLNDGTWEGQGGHENSIFAWLAWLADGSAASITAADDLAAYYDNQTNAAIPQHGLHHWKCFTVAIYLSEYYNKTSTPRVLIKLQTPYTYLIDSQYKDISQLVLPRPHDVDPTKFGFDGWGHNPGFEGYGPICMATGQGALAPALMDRVGVTVDRTPPRCRLRIPRQGHWIKQLCVVCLIRMGREAIRMPGLISGAPVRHPSPIG